MKPLRSAAMLRPCTGKPQNMGFLPVKAVLTRWKSQVRIPRAHQTYDECLRFSSTLIIAAAVQCHWIASPGRNGRATSDVTPGFHKRRVVRL